MKNFSLADQILMDRIFDNAQDVFNTAIKNDIFSEEIASSIMYMHSYGNDKHYFKDIVTRRHYVARFWFFGPYFSIENK